MITLNNILDEALEINVINIVNHNLFTINPIADENDVENFLISLLYYYEDIVCILRNNKDCAIGLFITR